MGKTGIEWATHSWNPYSWDCTRVSPGCKNCYMMTMAHNFGKPQTGKPQFIESKWKELKTFAPGSVIFVNSMSDTYHESVPVKWIHSIHNAALMYPDLTFLLLTKRPERALGLSPYLAYPPNLWVGVSVENEDYLWRVEWLLKIPAAGHFVSAEPLLGPLPGIWKYISPHRYATMPKRPQLKWVIVGGESGKNRRPFEKRWASEIQAMCWDADVPFMFKQGSAYGPGQDRLLNGQEWNGTPFNNPHPPTPSPLHREGESAAVAVQLKLFDVPEVKAVVYG